MSKTAGSAIGQGSAIGATTIDFSLRLSKWERFYKDAFGRKYDFSGLIIPQADDIFAWLICMVPDIPAEDLLSGGKNPQPSWRWRHITHKLDDVLDLSFGRDGWAHKYLVCAKVDKEADEGLRFISAEKIAEMKIDTLGLRERLVIGRFLHWNRKLILDRRTWTLCAGSRCRGGNVPYVDFSEVSGKVGVDWCSPDYANGLLRARQAVS